MPAPVDVRNVKVSLERQSVLVAAVCLAGDLLAFAVSGPVDGVRHAIVIALIVLADAALALPARWSGWVALAQAVVRVLGAVLVGGVQPGRDVNDAGILIAGYRAGAWLRGGPAVASLVAVSLGVLVCRVIATGHADPTAVLIDIARDALLPWLVGRYTTARGAYIAVLEQRAENQRREAAVAVERAVADERSAIARDLHDVISHHVSAIGMHAGAARLALAPGTGGGVAGSLTAVEGASRAALHDLRRMLDLLHGTAGEGARQPGLANLDELLDGVRRAGLPARLRTTGTPRPVPESLDVALYRICQEMLTNALRHGDGTPVDVELEHGPDALTLRVRNGIGTGTVPVEPRTARGLTGIRTRAEMFGGTVAHGPDPGGRGWTSAVTVPVEGPGR